VADTGAIRTRIETRISLGHFMANIMQVVDDDSPRLQESFSAYLLLKVSDFLLGFLVNNDRIGEIEDREEFQIGEAVVDDLYDRPVRHHDNTLPPPACRSRISIAASPGAGGRQAIEIEITEARSALLARRAAQRACFKEGSMGQPDDAYCAML
jgi:hypothetical protein